jgi:hypothetical protein
MTFSVDPEVDAVLAASFEYNGPPPTPPAGSQHERIMADPRTTDRSAAPSPVRC